MPKRWPVSSSYSSCKRASELLVGLVGDDRQPVDSGSWMRSPSWLTGSRSPRPISWRLRSVRLRLVQRADLEDVGVVPALTQRRVAEDEPERLVGREQPLLVAHDEVVGVDVGRAVAARVLWALLVVDAEVAAVHLGTGGRFERCVSRLVRRAPRRPPRTTGRSGRARVALVVDAAVVRDFVDEEERQNLHAERRAAFAPCRGADARSRRPGLGVRPRRTMPTPRRASPPRRS